MSHNALISLFRHKAWSNDQLFSLLATLPEGKEGVVPSCLRTLNHAYVVDQIFRDHLTSVAPKFTATNTVDVPDLAALKALSEDCDLWYLNYVLGLKPDALSQEVAFVFTSGNPGRMTREEILLHVLTHGVYHRGNVGQILKSASIQPPDDPYTVFLHAVEPSRGRHDGATGADKADAQLRQ
jgi:uncharacterized damage-inducible protein DinB